MMTALLDISRANRSVLATVEALHRASGFSPTVGEIAAVIGKSRSTIHSSLHALRDAGLVEWEPVKARTLRVTDAGSALLGDSSRTVATTEGGTTMTNPNDAKGDGWELVTQTDNGLHADDPAIQPSQLPVDLGADDE